MSSRRCPMRISASAHPAATCVSAKPAAAATPETAGSDAAGHPAPLDWRPRATTRSQEGARRWRANRRAIAAAATTTSVFSLPVATHHHASGTAAAAMSLAATKRPARRARRAGSCVSGRLFRAIHKGCGRHQRETECGQRQVGCRASVAGSKRDERRGIDAAFEQRAAVGGADGESGRG